MEGDKKRMEGDNNKNSGERGLNLYKDICLR